MPVQEKFKHKKSLGQHFLTSSVVPRWMCDAADITSSDFILEIGPGTGVLTKELLTAGAQVLALEADPRAIAILEETFTDEIENNQLLIKHVDVRTFDITNCIEIKNKKFKVVANIPYYLSGFLFRMFLESSVQPTDLVFLVQKEVAKRATSNILRGDKESLLSLSVQAYGTAKYIKTVSRGHFTPPPKVDSGVIAIRDISKDNFSNVNESLFFNTLHLGFGQKRKQLLGNLSKQYSRELLTHTFSTIGISLHTRAEDVPLEKWLLLVEQLSVHS